MKTLYLDCSMGAAGDMLTAALCSLLPDPEAFVRELNSLGLPGVEVRLEEKSQYGLSGKHISVLIHGEDEEEHGHAHEHEHTHEHGHTHAHHDRDHDHAHSHHHHADLPSIRAILESLPVSDRVKKDAAAVYELIAQAEAKVHGQPVELVHFHEVGALDAVADVTAVCLLMEKLGLDGFAVSPVHVGSGTVKCAHGVLSVPAPATAELLTGLPCYGGEVKGELCTPTGAALLRYFGRSFGPMPLMRTEKTGVGVGTRDFGRCNCLRAFLGESGVGDADSVVELSCNLDDMTGEALGYAMDRLLESGVADVFFTPITMKKNRPAVMLSCICPPEKREAVTAALFRHTTTIGVRETEHRRSILKRTVSEEETSLGPVRVKRAEGCGVSRVKPEYDDVKRLAEERGLSFAQASDQIKAELMK